MKILIHCTLPFALAHGGHAIQIQRTMAALQEIGMDVEPLRWWDESQTGDLIHYFGRMPSDQIHFAQNKGISVILTNLFTATCNYPDAALRRRGRIIKLMRNLPFGRRLYHDTGLDVFSACDHNIVGLEAERPVLELIYHLPPEKTTVVPLGLDDVFLKASPADRSGNHLVCAGTITGRKNCIPLAQLAHKARVPILFVGKPYTEKDPYWIEFSRLIDGHWVQHQPHVSSPAAMIALLQKARGAVVMSQYENWCFTAHEAAACGLPLLLQDQKWSRERFGNRVRYFKTIGYNNENVRRLKEFYADASGLPAPDIKLYSWIEVAQELKEIYRKVCSISK